MGWSTFGFRDVWRAEAPVSRVHAVLVDLEHYPLWWPQVRAVAKIDDDTALVVCRSALPYSLDLVLHAVRRDPGLVEVAIDGDLVGTARFRLTPDRDGTRLDFDQRVRVGNRLLRAASYVVRPLLVRNHQRMMRDGAAGLAQLSMLDMSP